MLQLLQHHLPLSFGEGFWGSFGEKLKLVIFLTITAT